MFRLISLFYLVRIDCLSKNYFCSFRENAQLHSYLEFDSRQNWTTHVTRITLMLYSSGRFNVGIVSIL